MSTSLPKVTMLMLAKRQRTVLVVEDDEPTRLAVAALLVREGYLALTAATSHDALETLRTPLRPVDVVLLDIGLPDVDGATLWSRVHELYPALPVIVCTGGAEPAEAAQLLDLGVRRYFLKPVSTDELLAVVRATLAPTETPDGPP